jgi:hypothetical protein
MFKVAFHFRAAAASANNKTEDFKRAVHPQTNRRLVGACKALVVRLKIGIKMSNLILP